MKRELARNLIASVASAAMFTTATAAMAESADRLTTLTGLEAAGAESALQSRGFKFITSNKNSMGYIYSYWWDSEDKNCVQVEAYNNRVETITDASDADCHHSGGSTAAAVGAVAGLAVIGALLSHKSNHHDDNKHHSSETAEQQYERGFNDGLYNAAYHNRDRSDEYSSGYSAGVEQRNANLRDHHGRGGYVSTAEFTDLNGARASGAMSELERRGFRQVDNFTSGNTRYSIQWREQSRQCVQVTIADGRIEDARDIHTHPNCRTGGGPVSSLPSNWYQRLPGAANEFAESELSKANFSRVDEFNNGSSGHGYVWYNRSNRQCLQVITSHGRVESAVDIRTHQKCR